MDNITYNKCLELLINHIIQGGGKALRSNVPRWMGHKVIKLPEDLILYQQIIYKHRPNIIIETGTKFGGSALFFANMFDLLGSGKVITIDIVDFPNKPKHPRITYLTGESTSTVIKDAIWKKVKGKKCMVSLDSTHDSLFMNRELECYYEFVTPEQFLVVEDVSYPNRVSVVNQFVSNHPEFKKTNITNQFLMHITKNGWLQRKTKEKHEEDNHQIL